MNPFSWQGQNLCGLSSVFVKDWRVVFPLENSPWLLLYMTTPVVSHMCRLHWPPKNWQNLGISRVSFNHHLYVAFSSALLTNEQMVPFKTLIFLFQDLRPGWCGGTLPKAVSQQDRPVYRPQRITNMGDLPFGMKKIVISNFSSPDTAQWCRKFHFKCN